MAVSLNANFMRSDYMLSDAALPLRLEELEQAELMEKGAKFSELLGEISDTTTSAPVDTSDSPMVMTQEQPRQFDSTDELAQAVANGEIQLKDIPKELVTSELLRKVAKLIAKPQQSDKYVPEADNELQQVVVSELMAAYAVQENVPADRTAELNELAASVAGKADAVETVQAVETDILQLTKPVTTEMASEELIPNTDVSAADTQPTEPVQQSDVKAENVPVMPEQKAEAKNSEATVQNELFAEAEQTDAPVETEKVVVSVKAEKAAPVMAETSEQPDKAITVETTEIAEPVQADAEPTAEAVEATEKPQQPMTEAKPQADMAAAHAVQAETVYESKPVENVKQTQQPEKTADIAPVADIAVQQPEQNRADSGAQQGMSQQWRNNDTQQLTARQPVSEKLADSIHNDMARAMSRIETRTIEQPKAEQVTQPQQVSFTAAKSERVISKTNELSMIKEATRPAQQTTELPVNVMPQAALDTVVYQRAEGGEIEISTDELLQQVADKVIETAELPAAEGGTEYKVTLTPEDLGTITVKMTKAVDGSVTVSITADNAKTQRILEEHSALIQTNLKNNGIELESWQTVNESQREPYAEDYNGSSRNPYQRNDEGSNNDDADDNTFAELIASM